MSSKQHVMFLGITVKRLLTGSESGFQGGNHEPESDKLGRLTRHR